jgi:hypothetical protein
MIFTRLFFITILFLNTLNGNQKDNSIFISPVKIPILLSANFGELRIDHFHSGIDIKTQGVTGQEVVAAASGYIYRISVSPGGFGNALYVSHFSGFSTVYGHLDKFAPEIEEYVKSQQYAKKSFIVNLFPPKEKFPVRQGELIAYSGNSGSSSGPHLHYEIRKSQNEMPINPLLFEFGADDDIKPVIEKLVIYPINRYTLINNLSSARKINVSGRDGYYYIPEENEIRISGMAGFGIKSFDQLNGSYNKCSVYSIELTIDSIPIFKYVMDGFSFNESRYINSHIDYETYMKENIYIERAFILPNDKLSAYKDFINRGIYNFNDNRIHHAEITVTDVHKNRSVLSFKIKAQSEKSRDLSKLPDKNITLMPFNRRNEFVTDNLTVRIPAGALYDTLYFEYRSVSGNKEMYSDLHYIHNRFTPLQKAYTLSIKPDKIPAGKETKMLIVHLGDDMKKSATNSSWSDGYLTTEIMSFGKFFVGIDSIAPVILTTGLFPGVNLTGKKDIRIRITDDFSGIKSYEPSIDGRWALFEYDSKNNLLIYRFDEKRIIKGAKHDLVLKVSDNMDNISVYNCDFTW